MSQLENLPTEELDDADLMAQLAAAEEEQMAEVAAETTPAAGEPVHELAEPGETSTQPLAAAADPITPVSASEELAPVADDPPQPKDLQRELASLKAAAPEPSKALAAPAVVKRKGIAPIAAAPVPSAALKKTLTAVAAVKPGPGFLACKPTTAQPVAKSAVAAGASKTFPAAAAPSALDKPVVIVARSIAALQPLALPAANPSGPATANPTTKLLVKPKAPAKPASSVPPKAPVGSKVLALSKVSKTGVSKAVVKVPKAVHVGSKPPKKRAAKGEAKPRARSAYLYFCEEKRAEVKAQEEGLSMGDVARQLGQLWKATSTEDRVIYEEASAEYNNSVLKELQEAWNEAHPQGDAEENPEEYDEDGPVPPPHKKAKTSAALRPAAKAARVKKTYRASTPILTRPPSAEALFRKHRRSALLEEEPGADLADLGARIAAEWAALTPQDQAPWLAEAQEKQLEFFNSLPAAPDDADMMDPAMTGGALELDAATGEAGMQTSSKRGGRPKSSKNKGPRSKGSRGGLRGSTTAEEGAEGDGEEGPAEEAEVDALTSPPHFILCHDRNGKYLVVMEGASNFYDYVTVDANKVKQLRTALAEGDTVDEPPEFGGHGAQLVELANEFDLYRRRFEADAHTVMDEGNGMNWDLMPASSTMDMCAVLGQMRNTGGLLSGKPGRHDRVVRGVDDPMMNVPVLATCFVLQRWVDYWRDRALLAEGGHDLEQLAE